MVFCPDWIFDIAVARTAQEFLASDVPMFAAAGKYAEGLGEKYAPIDKSEINDTAEQLLHFLSEVNAGEDAVTFLNGFTYFKYNFESVNKPRKLNPMFGAADDPVKIKSHSGEIVVKHFKAYVFGLRSNSAPVAPVGWRLDVEENSLHIAEVARRTLSILDAF
jgi:hypothetical protein